MASVGEVWLVDFGEPYPGEPARQRPAVIVGPPETFGPGFPYAIVMPMTTTPRDLPTHVEVEPTEETGLDDVSYVQCELVRSVNRSRLMRRLGPLDFVAQIEVQAVSRVLLGH